MENTTKHTDEVMVSRALNLWKLAVDKLEDETRKNIAGSGDDIDLVKALIDEINKKKKENCFFHRSFLPL